MAERSRQPDSGERPLRRRHPAQPPAPAGEVLVTDLRKSGWSWGWDTLAREFAALLQLSGIGLYFTYATYTDNRKESPYRGSSYTGVEALAAFTGESADDIRTLNKILAALGLARFETYTVYVPTQDGRRATRNRLHCYLIDRDPHLTADDVLAVLRLALADRKVYKQIRHLFRPEFRPIDRLADASGTPREHPNPWYAILPAIKRTSEWRALALRAERDLLALRERNMAGVEAAARRRQRDHAASSTILRDTEDGDTSILPATEDGSRVPLTEDAPPSTLPATDDACARDLPGREGKDDQDLIKQKQSRQISTKPETPTTTTREEALNQSENCREATRSPGESTLEDVVTVFGQANGRETTPVERDLLRQIIADFDAPARAYRPDHSGALWVIAAIIEAVEAGSRFVSPRRIRTICGRWVRDGFPAAGQAVGRAGRAGAAPSPPEVPEVVMPNGQSGRLVWRRVLGIARGSVSAEVLIRWLEPCAIVGYDAARQEITIAVPDEPTREKLDRTYRQLLERALATIFRTTVRVRCTCPDPPAEDCEDEESLRPVLTGGEDEPLEPGWETADEICAGGGADDSPGDADAGGESGEAASPGPAERAVGGGATPADGPDVPARADAHSHPPLLVGMISTRITEGMSNQELWVRALAGCDQLSALRRQLFETHAALARQEERDLIVVAANRFIADQLERYRAPLENSLRTLLGDDELRLRCTLLRLTAPE